MAGMAPRWSWLLALVVVAAGCGGVVSGSDGGPGSDGGTGSDGGGGGGGCPASQPTVGAACSTLNMQCEYGSNPNPSCNQLFECTSSGWVDQSSGGACPPSSLCPSSYTSVPAGQSCSPDTLTCAYPDGECICTTNFGGPQSQTARWDCIPATNGCPSPRPDIGASCSQPGLDCNYGACSGGVDLVCKDGRWQQQNIPCPL
ncbi:MAG: hypothetical protein LUO89_12905 [Methanothrix sp.]|nr:hypothetical protein [Methanothrix sp.]